MGLWLLGAILFTATPAQAEGLLTLIAVTDGDATPSFWWSAGRSASLSPPERALLEPARSQGLAVLDPGAVANPPPISRIYRRPDLTPANAINLAGLYGASAVVLGRVVRRPHGAADAVGLAGHEVEVALRVLSVQSRRELGRFAVTRHAFAPEEDAARREALAAAMAEAGMWVAAQGSQMAGSTAVGLDDRDEPYMVVSGLWTMEALATLQKRIAQQAGSVRLAWLAPGRVGLDIAPEQKQSRSDLEALTQTLIDAPPEGMRLTPTPGAPEPTWLSVERVPNSEPGTSQP
ncbi:MAG: hypothetical protein AAFS10_18945, partial [Myxococcota bacterium]